MSQLCHVCGVSHLGYTSPRLPAEGDVGPHLLPQPGAPGWFCVGSASRGTTHTIARAGAGQGGSRGGRRKETSTRHRDSGQRGSAAAGPEAVPEVPFAVACSTTPCASTRSTSRPAGLSCWRRSTAPRRRCSSSPRCRHVPSPGAKPAPSRGRLGHSPGQELCLHWGCALGVRNNQQHPSTKATEFSRCTNYSHNCGNIY